MIYQANIWYGAIQVKGALPLNAVLLKYNKRFMTSLQPGFDTTKLNTFTKVDYVSLLPPAPFKATELMKP